jgi:hypothetical protein
MVTTRPDGEPNGTPDGAPSGTPGPLTILSGGKATTIARGLPAPGGGEGGGEDAWLPLAALPEASGWELKPEGLCRDEVCVPVPPSQAATLLREAGGETWLDLAAFARHVGLPYARDRRRNVWSFGPPAYEWQGRRGTGPAPDFTLPDFAGRPHSLSDYRGTKVFLVTWASW